MKRYSNLENTYSSTQSNDLPSYLHLMDGDWCQNMNDTVQKNMRPGIDVCASTCANNNCNYNPSGNNLEYLHQDTDTELLYNSPACTAAHKPSVPYCTMPLPQGTFFQENNPDDMYGCQSTEIGDESAISSNDDEHRVKKYCYYNENCKGYYSNGSDWYIATDKYPIVCDKSQNSGAGYPIFNRKLKYPPSNGVPDKYDHLRYNKNPVCVSPYSSSSDNETYVKNLCEINPDCKGYYSNDYNSWFIATDTDPRECKDRTLNDKWATFHSKESNYKASQFNLGYYGCQLKMSNTCNGTDTDNCKSYVEPLCDIDPNCIGYFSDDMGNYAATQNLTTRDDNTCQTYLYKPPNINDGSNMGFNVFNRKR